MAESLSFLQATMVSEPTMIMAVTLFRNALNITREAGEAYQQFKRIALGDFENFDADPREQAAARDEFHENGGPNDDADGAPINHLNIGRHVMPIMHFLTLSDPLPSGQ